MVTCRRTMSNFSCAATPAPEFPFVAIGIISAPTFIERRAAIRATWLSHCSIGREIAARFVIRALNAPPPLDRLLSSETLDFGDVFRAQSVPWNETRLRGPVLSLHAWLRHAVGTFPRTPFVAKVDDDSYVQPAELAVLARAVSASVGPERPVYLGVFTYFSWFPTIFERSGYGWSYGQALGARWCSNATFVARTCGDNCGLCVGPFPFGSGFLLLLSRSLAGHLLESPGVDDDLARLRRAKTLPTRKGGVQEKVMEDIWLGSALFRFPPPNPVAYVNILGGGVTSDDWALNTLRSALLVHIKGKVTGQVLAVHDFMQSADHCAQSSLQSGCAAFGQVGDAGAGPAQARRAPVCYLGGARQRAAPRGAKCRLALNGRDAAPDVAERAARSRRDRPAAHRRVRRRQPGRLLRPDRALREAGEEAPVAGQRRLRAQLRLRNVAPRALQSLVDAALIARHARHVRPAAGVELLGCLEVAAPDSRDDEAEDEIDNPLRRRREQRGGAPQEFEVLELDEDERLDRGARAAGLGRRRQLLEAQPRVLARQLPALACRARDAWRRSVASSGRAHERSATRCARSSGPSSRARTSTWCVGTGHGGLTCASATSSSWSDEPSRTEAHGTNAFQLGMRSTSCISARKCAAPARVWPWKRSLSLLPLFCVYTRRNSSPGIVFARLQELRLPSASALLGDC